MTEASIEIIKLLPDTRLGWIADVLVESIALGKQTTKDFREPGAPRAIKATSVEPFSEQEEMELVVETLAQYFIVMPTAWDIARERFARKDTFRKVHLEADTPLLHGSVSTQTEDFSAGLGIVGDGEEAFQTFSATWHNQTQPALRRVLSKLWPHGPEEFTKRFCAEVEVKK